MTTVYFSRTDPTSPTYRKSLVELEEMHQNGKDILYTDFMDIIKCYPNWRNAREIVTNSVHDNFTWDSSTEKIHYINTERLLNLCPSEYRTNLITHLISVDNTVTRHLNQYVVEYKSDVDCYYDNSDDMNCLILQGDTYRKYRKLPTLKEVALHELGLVEHINFSNLPNMKVTTQSFNR